MRSKAEESEFAKTIAVLFETLPPRKPVTPIQLRGYSVALGDLTAQQVQHAATRALKECTFMPSPLELLTLAGEETVESRAMTAWTTAMKAVSDLGPYKHVDFEDHRCNTAIRSMGDWPTFCGRFEVEEGKKSDLQWVKKEFMSAYSASANIPDGCEASATLPGLATSYEWADGSVHKPPIHRIEKPATTPRLTANTKRIEAPCEQP